MSGAVKPLAALLREQAQAADPDVHAWVAASAGTGKTQVLTARVLRLLLAGARAEAILCLTFTKLAAAEMQNRVMARLAHWAGCSDAALASDIAAIGGAADTDTMSRARGLFAAVLETPAGLAIQTIHSFAQGLIAAFPVEAAISPGFQTLDDRAGILLRGRVLNDALTGAMATHPLLRADLAEVALDGGEGRLQELMSAAATHEEALAPLRIEGVDPLLRRFLGLPADGGSAEAALEAALATLPLARLTSLGMALGQQSGVNAIKLAEKLAAALTMADAQKRWTEYWGCFFTTANAPRALSMIPKALDTANPDWKPFCADMQDQLLTIRAEQERWEILAIAGRHLRLAITLAQDWQAAKARAGVIDYADMIAAAVRLLGLPGAAQWVRFKLDSRIDHVLVDEAQDTNLAQWEVIAALVEEFFAGFGQRDQFRSLFVVGDFKQSIFSFQGADPMVYADRREIFFQQCEAEPERWMEVPLARNFRSADVILDVVDRVITHVGATPFGGEAVPAHTAFKAKAGVVTLWPPLLPDAGEEADEGEPGTAGLASEIDLARRIAATIAGWLSGPQPLILPGIGRRAAPQDVMILVRRRGRLMNALVGALHEQGVAVAGADRLNLSEPLAVADLVALVQFVCQPGDDLTLAALLVSPLVGLTHDRLTILAAGRTGSLWAAVQASDAADVVAARDWLARVLRLGAEVSPYRFLESVLSGPSQGRARLLARLGEEARDAIDTVLDQALACEAAGAASLQAFLAWMAADDLEVKRDPEAALDAVRLMTVHGAKGLQAPIVILADACAPPQARNGVVALPLDGHGSNLPLWLPPGLVAPPTRIAEALERRKADAAAEDRRLMYVALTRAEEILCIGGASKPTKEWEVHPQSWYAAVEDALAGADFAVQDHPAWSEPVRHLRGGTPVALVATEIAPAAGMLPLGNWWREQVRQEARPPRPLSPSSLGPDPVADPPPSPDRRAAARRGTALHKLFETLPDLPADRREAVARAWVSLNVPDLDADDLVGTVLRVLDDPAFAEVFGDDALTEAPVAAVAGGQVIAGSIDRLLVRDTEILAVEFKTGSRVPADASAVPAAHVAQLGAYAAALACVFPGRVVRAALLYTAGPRLIELSGDVLSVWKENLGQENLGHQMADAALPGGGPMPIFPE
ncbi:double-strand break repair helicase AddA [Sandarakinorhabdus sp.]|uniref:double-strand break repair helicase AddA n=1 Tax=Sandarakinorhabdus sp. TaxID=1916663 RepID=UPI003F6FD242